MAASPPTDAPRFKTISSPCEWIEDYRPGGYHPVHIGDTFKNGQYQILRKLGEGSYSTVWLVRDSSDKRYCALKILCADISEPTNELNILHHINRTTSDGSDYVTQLLDEFSHHGPNGNHKCLVFEPMGPSANSMVEELPQFKPRMIHMTVRYPPWMAKSILKQSLRALAFLHGAGVAHGDFQPGNMHFCLQNIDQEREDVLRQKLDEEAGSISPPVERLDGQEDPSAPRYLCIAQPLASFTRHGEGFKIKLSDMGGAYFFSELPAKPITPLGLQAPELVVNGVVSKSLDIWSFGCLVFEFITGQPLFCVQGPESETDSYLLWLHSILGRLPDELFDCWETFNLYFTADKELFNCHLGGVLPGGEPLMIEQQSMEELFDEAATGLGQEEADMVKRLIRRVLQYDPVKRPSPEEILADPWFN